MLRGGRPSARLIVLLIVLTAAGCRSGQSTPSVVEQVGSTAPGPGPAGGPAKVAPRWEPVAAFAGTGDQRTAGFEIGAGAIQWRVTVSCTGGAVRVGLDREPAALAELSHCPAKAFGFSIRTGPAALDVAATGTWEVVVDQQVDSPVVEPLLAGMSDATRLAHGDFYGIDQQGSGTVALYRLPGGEHVLRLDPFLVTRNSDLFLWVSEARAPRTSEEALLAPHAQVDRLKSTGGAQNYVLEASVDLDRVRSVVVWCEPVRTAYAAATLLP